MLDVDGNVIADLGPTEGGFVAGIYRVLERERGGRRPPCVGAYPAGAFFQHGRIGLRDDLTDFRAELFGFGQATRRSLPAFWRNDRWDGSHESMKTAPCEVEVSHRFDSLHAHVKFLNGAVINPGDESPGSGPP